MDLKEIIKTLGKDKPENYNEIVEFITHQQKEQEDYKIALDAVTDALDDEKRKYFEGIEIFSSEIKKLKEVCNLHHKERLESLEENDKLKRQVKNLTVAALDMIKCNGLTPVENYWEAEGRMKKLLIDG